MCTMIWKWRWTFALCLPFFFAFDCKQICIDSLVLHTCSLDLLSVWVEKGFALFSFVPFFFQTKLMGLSKHTLMKTRKQQQAIHTYIRIYATYTIRLLFLNESSQSQSHCILIHQTDLNISLISSIQHVWFWAFDCTISMPLWFFVFLLEIPFEWICTIDLCVRKSFIESSNKKKRWKKETNVKCDKESEQWIAYLWFPIEIIRTT